MAKKSFFLKPANPQTKKAPPRRGAGPFSGGESLEARRDPPSGILWHARLGDPPQKFPPGKWWGVFRDWGDGHSRTHIGYVEGNENDVGKKARKAWPQYAGTLTLEEYPHLGRVKAGRGKAS